MVGPRTVWQSCGRAFESKELVYFVCLLCSVTDWSTRGERGLGVNSTLNIRTQQLGLWSVMLPVAGEL